MSEVTIGVLRAADRAEQLAYERGAEDMRKANRMLYEASTIGLTSQKMEELFGTYYIPSILDRCSAIRIIESLNSWRKEKEQYFKVGDEVECTDSRYANYKEKYVVVEVFEYNNQKAIRLINLRNVTLHESTCPEGYRKTGKHYDAIPIPKEDEGEEE